MEHYSTNAQNRKLKKQILTFLSRIGFAGGKLPTSGKLILVFSIGLIVSIFLPWIEISSPTQGVHTYSAFSQYLGYIGIGVIISIIIIPFFLLSHTKKEHIRAYVPFRLSDTQAIIFVASMLLVALIQLFILSPLLQQLGGTTIRQGFILAITSVIMIIICGYFLSQKIKNENSESYYLNRDSEADFGEYTNIIHANPQHEKERKKQNMSLPI